MKYLKAIDHWIEKFATVVVIVSVVAMLVLSLGVIGLRWIDISFLWTGPLINHLVFLSVFAGGIIVTGNRSHIAIDVLSNYLANNNMGQILVWCQRLIALVAAITMVILAKVSVDFVNFEATYNKEIFLGITSTYLVAIIPWGSSLMGYRFFFHTFIFISSKHGY